MLLQMAPVLACHDTDLRQPPRQLRRALDLGRQPRRAGRQRRIVERTVDPAPVQRGVIRDRRVEIVAERRAECALVAGRHAQLVDHRRQAIVARRQQQLGQRFDFGAKLAGRQQRGLARLLAHPRLRRHLDGVLLGNECFGFDLADLAHQALAGLAETLQSFRVRRLGRDVAGLRGERHKLLLDPANVTDALGVRALEAAAACPRLDDPPGQLDRGVPRQHPAPLRPMPAARGRLPRRPRRSRFRR